MGVKIFYSSDTGAPTLGPNAGDLVNVLRKCLVDGYGSKTALAGWSCTFDSTYKYALIKSIDSGATGCCVHINDSTTTYATTNGYETATGLNGDGTINNGVNLWFGGGPVSKGNAGNRQWTLIGDEKLFYLFIQSASYSSENYSYGGMIFGDIVSTKAGDLWNCVLMTDFGTNCNQWTYSYTHLSYLASYWRVGLSYHSVARPYTGIVGGMGVSKLSLGSTYASNSQIYKGYGPSNYPNGSGGTITSMPFPNSTDNGFYINPVAVVEASSGCLRGYLPGLYDSPHFRPMGHKTTITGASILPGRTIQALFQADGGSPANLSGYCYMDITGPWR